MIQINHAAYQKAMKGKSFAELQFIVRDCKEAIAANPDNPKCGYYADEVHYASMEMTRRQLK